MSVRAAVVLAFAGSAGCLSYQEFLTKRHDKYCEELANCNPDIPCDIPIGLDTGYANDECDFDAGAARDCLHGTWTCATPGAGFEYPLPPPACDAVCGGATTASTGG
jgi:hypothetical protein